MKTKIFYLLLPPVTITILLICAYPYIMMYKSGINPVEGLVSEINELFPIPEYKWNNLAKMVMGVDTEEPIDIIENLNLSGYPEEVFRIKVYPGLNALTFIIEKKVDNMYVVTAAFGEQNGRYEPPTYEIIHTRSIDYLAVTSIGASGSGHLERYTTWYTLYDTLTVPNTVLTYGANGFLARDYNYHIFTRTKVMNDLMKDDSFVELKSDRYRCESGSVKAFDTETNLDDNPKCKAETMTKKYLKNEDGTFPEVDHGLQTASMDELLKDAVLIR